MNRVQIVHEVVRKNGNIESYALTGTITRFEGGWSIKFDQVIQANSGEEHRFKYMMEIE